MNDYLESLALEDLNGEQRELAECIGIDAYKKLVKTYGGSSVYVCKPDTILKVNYYNEIRQNFNGYNFRELAQKYSLSERTVRRILEDDIKQAKNEPIEGQMTFDI